MSLPHETTALAMKEAMVLPDMPLHAPTITNPSSLQQATPPSGTQPSLDDGEIVHNHRGVPAATKLETTSKPVTPPSSTPPSLNHHHQAFPHFDNYPSLSSNTPGHILPADYLYDGVSKFLQLSRSGSEGCLTISNVTVTLYKEIMPKLEKRLRCEYDFINEKMTVYPCPSPVHASIMNFIAQLATGVNSRLCSITSAPDICFADIGSYPARLKGENGQKTRDKQANRAYKIRYKGFKHQVYPSFVVEVGYLETYVDLQNNAKQWLCETAKQVVAVLVVKLTKPELAEDFVNIQKWGGFMELYVRRYVPSFADALSTHLLLGRDDSMTGEISCVSERVSFLPPSPNTPPLVLSLNHVMGHAQIEALGLQDVAAQCSWPFDPSGIVEDVEDAIVSMMLP